MVLLSLIYVKMPHINLYIFILVHLSKYDFADLVICELCYMCESLDTG